MLNRERCQLRVWRARPGRTSATPTTTTDGDGDGGGRATASNALEKRIDQLAQRGALEHAAAADAQEEGGERVGGAAVQASESRAVARRGQSRATTAAPPSPRRLLPRFSGEDLVQEAAHRPAQDGGRDGGRGGSCPLRSGGWRGRGGGGVANCCHIGQVPPRGGPRNQAL